MINKVFLEGSPLIQAECEGLMWEIGFSNMKYLFSVLATCNIEDAIYYGSSYMCVGVFSDEDHVSFE